MHRAYYVALAMTNHEIDDALRRFHADGYARLGVQVSADTLRGLRERLDDIMLGRVDPTPFFFQHDSASGRYEDLAFGEGFIGPSLSYRKVERLERDDRFLAYATQPLFERITRRAIGGPVSLYRALVFGKSAEGGTELPWHQDGGEFWGLDREPFLQLWTALDDAPVAAGCLEILPDTHHAGLATPEGGIVPRALFGPIEHRSVALPAVAGEVILLHNHLWHRSQRNRTGLTRRGLTLCFLDARTRCRRKKNPREFFRIFP